MLRPILTTKHIKSNYMRSTLMIRKGTEWVTATRRKHAAVPPVCSHTLCPILSLCSAQLSSDNDNGPRWWQTGSRGTDVSQRGRCRPSQAITTTVWQHDVAGRPRTRKGRQERGLTDPATYLVNVAEHGVNKSTHCKPDSPETVCAMYFTWPHLTTCSLSS